MNSISFKDNLFSKIKEPTYKEYDLFRKLVLKLLGISLLGKKKYFLHARLQKRLQFLNLKTYSEYYNYIVLKKNFEELQNVFDLVTTTKTGFFREKQHFEFLVKYIFPRFKEKNITSKKKLRFWNVGCSSGEEVYSLAIEAQNFFGLEAISKGALRILGSDINSEVLKIANLGRYSKEQISHVSGRLVSKFFKCSANNYQISPKLKELIQFRKFNLMDNDYPIATKFQLIFCRNVLFYIEPNIRGNFLKKILKNLDSGGWLILGITESSYKIDGFKKWPFSIYEKIKI